MSITVKVRASTTVVTIKKMKFNSNHTVYDIKKAYCDEHNNSKTPQKIVFRSKGKELKPDNATLSSVGIRGRMVIVSMSSKLRGGAQYIANINVLNSNRSRKFNTTDSDIKISNKACCVYLDKTEGRAEMPCGYAFTSKSMFDTLKAVITKNQYEYMIMCPGCGKEMDFDLCAKIADLNDQEYEYFLIEFDKRASPETKDCPDCKMPCERPDNLKIFRVNCTSCKGGDWCFMCAQKWKQSGFTVCGNKDCAVYEINEILLECPMKKATNGVNVPELRACPQCLEFIEHEDACKHMKCEKCSHEFCFACLKPKKDGKWQCGNHTQQCVVAPRQQF